MIHWSQFPYSKSTQVQFNSISIQHLYYCSTKQFLSPLTNKEIYTPRVLPDCSQVTAPSQSCYVKIYIIIAVGPLYVCLCVCVSELLRDGWTDLLHFLGKDRYYIWPGSYLCFMTLGQRSRPPEVIEFIYLFDSM